MAPPLHKCIQDPKRFAELIDAYIDACLVRDSKGRDSAIIGIASASLALGCDRDAFNDWSKRYAQPTEHDPECYIVRAIKKLHASSESQLERLSVIGRNSVALAMGKIKHRWIEEQHVKHEHAGGVTISVDFGMPITLANKDASKRASKQA